nr:putative general secretion pathway protein GspB [Escherichia coli]
MFEFYIAAREQKETGHPGIFSRQKHSTIIYVICLLLICLWFAGMVLVGGYARQLWALWIVKAEVTVDAETPAFKQSTQHYFFKKQPLPVVELIRHEINEGGSVR